MTADFPACLSPVDLYISDPHGEYEEFSHIVRTACGRISASIDGVFEDELTAYQKAELATLVAYPKRKLAQLAQSAQSGQPTLSGQSAQSSQPAQSGQPPQAQDNDGDIRALYDTLYSRVNNLACFYGLSDLVFQVVEHLAEHLESQDASDNVEIPLEATAEAIITLCEAIQHASVRALHVLGDIYDRGPAPDLLMDELCEAENMDIIWGNHDILWMAAALGHPACVATAVRICARYGNLSVLEDNYGIDLSALRTFALTTYADDPCELFFVKHNAVLTDEDRLGHTKVQKAIAIIQFKLEAAIIAQNPSFDLASRRLLDKIDYAQGTVTVDGATYPMRDLNFPTVDKNDPYALTPGEQNVLDTLIDAFMSCERLSRHAQMFIDRGALYKIDGDFLSFHACVPLDPQGHLLEANLFGQTVKGKALFDLVERYVRDAYSATDAQAKRRGQDLMWYLWLSPNSPLFAKSKMATFELYFLEDKAIRKEAKNAFYELWELPAPMSEILADFGLDPETGRILCGHVPVKVKDGEEPVKCDGKVIVLDGGMSLPYQPSSGVAGFTLIKDKFGITMATHEHFCGAEAAIATNTGLVSTMWPID